MPSGRRILLALAIALFVTVNTFNALNKGGDAQDLFEGGRRWLHANPLYEGSGPASGFIGPPFQAAFLAPFGWLSQASDVSARLAWYVLNLGCLLVGIVYWLRALRDGRANSEPVNPWRRDAAWLAVLAIALPLQTNFEHQNMNAVLLGISGLAAWCLVGGRWKAAGAFIGVAAALKVFPALAIVYVATRRWWTCAAVALATAAVLTALSLVPYGARSSIQATSWVQVASGGWPTRPQNQSLLAAIDRFVPGGPLSGIHTVQQVPAEFGMFLAVAAALLAAALLVARGRKPVQAQIPCEFAAVMLLAVLLSPVAWQHYWVLLFPACLLMYDAQDPRLLGRRATVLFWTAAILTSGLSRLTLGADGWALARYLSVDTLAALILYGGLSALWPRLAVCSAPPLRRG